MSAQANTSRDPERERQQAIDAFRILDDLLEDLYIASVIFKYFNTEEFKDAFDLKIYHLSNRMVFQFLILTLVKWIEFYEKYKSVIPTSMKRICKAQYKELRDRRMKQLRDEVVGHVWNKKGRRPLFADEIEGIFKTVIKEDMEHFIRWIYNPPNNKVGKTVTGTILTLRDAIGEEWSLSDRERKKYST